MEKILSIQNFVIMHVRVNIRRDILLNNGNSERFLGVQLPTGVVKKFVKRYLREKYKDKCCLCGWCKINPYTGKIPLVADHIDGDHRNDTEENLRLICWNCDSIGPTFGALNKGNGRSHRYTDGQRNF